MDYGELGKLKYYRLKHYSKSLEVEKYLTDLVGFNKTSQRDEWKNERYISTRQLISNSERADIMRRLENEVDGIILKPGINQINDIELGYVLIGYFSWAVPGTTGMSVFTKIEEL